MVSENRPEWKHQIPEADARWLSGGLIVKITHHWKFTSEDTTEDWIELHRADGSARRFPSAFLNTNGYFEFRPNWRELVQPTYRGEQARKDFEAIDKWEKENAAERAEFERLKSKFDSTPSKDPQT